LMFGVMIDQRQSETGLLLAVGFTPSQVRRTLLTEGLVLAFLGVAAGVWLGIAYSRGVLWALCSVWQDAVRTTDLVVDVRPGTAVTGALVGLLAALFAMWITARRHSRRPVHSLQSRTAAMPGKRRGERRHIRYAAGACLIGAATILATTDAGTGKESAGAFFGAGALLLAGTLALCWEALAARNCRRSVPRVKLAAVAMNRLAASPGRSVGTIALVACGVFLVTAVAANRHDPQKSPHKRTSGTGGFAFFGETTLPLLDDLNVPQRRRSLGLGNLDAEAFSAVPLRIRNGDDASCANLNRVQQPALAGVASEELDRRRAFTFAKLPPEANAEAPWSVLDTELGDGTIPGIADYNVIVWSLGKSVGDTISYTDDQGRPLKVRLVAGLANSILQGYVLISDRAFREHFPSIAGTRALLIDVSREHEQSVEKALTDRFADLGMLLTPAARRMADIARLEDTYLAIFLVLGGLGLVLGSVGLGAVVLKNVEERRGELALLRAVGFSRARTIRLLLVEHAALLVLGVVCGTVSAGLAILPAIVAPGGTVPHVAVATIVAGILACGTTWILLAGLLSTRGPFLPALRSE
ncbi:MAG: ABC transporter permease, partial [Lentisphaerae bacterium]|nr:ABC transporter permease [Lentisphaerota bacterium]